MASVLLQIGLVYFLGHLFDFSFRKFRVPDILLFTIIGIILGPVLHVSKPEHFGEVGSVLSTLALIVILFESGTTLNFKKAAQASGLSSVLAIGTMIVTIAIVYFVTRPFTGSNQVSLLIGVITGGTSSAVVIPMVNVLGLNEKLKSTLIMESALTDVLCIVLTLTLSQSIIAGEFSAQSFLEKILLSFLVAIAIGGSVGILWAKFRPFIKAQFATIAIALIVYGLTELLGYSGPIAVMSMGILLTQAPRFIKNQEISPITDLESNFYSELVFIFKVFFFIFLGISLRIQSVAIVLISALAMATILILRFLIVRYIAKRSGTPNELTYTSLLIPKGLAAAVLAGVPSQMGFVAGGEIQDYVYTIVLVSIVMVSVLIPATQVPYFGRALAKFFGSDNRLEQK